MARLLERNSPREALRLCPCGCRIELVGGHTFLSADHALRYKYRLRAILASYPLRTLVDMFGPLPSGDDGGPQG